MNWLRSLSILSVLTLVIDFSAAATFITSPEGTIYVAGSCLDGIGTTNLTANTLKYDIEIRYPNSNPIVYENMACNGSGGNWFVDVDNDGYADGFTYAGNEGEYTVKVRQGVTQLDENEGQIVDLANL